MKPNSRSQWAGCSDFNKRKEELLKAHEEFERMLANGWKVTSVKKAKTPRKVVISIFGSKTTVTYQEYLNRCQGFKIIMEIF